MGISQPRINVEELENKKKKKTPKKKEEVVKELSSS
jgi:hypothetical protein